MDEIGPSHLEMEGPARMRAPSGMQQDQYGGFEYSQMTGRRKALFIGINCGADPSRFKVAGSDRGL